MAALGIYGVVAFVVSRRTREVGIRMALGARAADVRGLVVRQGMAPVLAGLVVTVFAFTGFVAAFTYITPMLRDVAGLGEGWVGAALVVIIKNVVSAYVVRWNFMLGAIFVAIVVFMPEGLVPGASTKPIVLRSNLGYTGIEPRNVMLKNSQFVDAHIQLFAKYGSLSWVRIAESPVTRQLINN